MGEVVEHIMTVLRNSKMVVWMCGDYSWILLHYLLQKQHYVVQISAAAWSGELCVCVCVCVCVFHKFAVSCTTRGKKLGSSTALSLPCCAICGVYVLHVQYTLFAVELNT